MSILINKNTRVMTQGITGKTGQFHTKMGKEYANGGQCYVAGVTPKKGGQSFEGIPILISSGVMTPGQLGPTRIVFFPCIR